MSWQQVCTTDDVDEDELEEFEVGGITVLVANAGDPAMAQQSPIEQYLPRYIVLVPSEWINDVLVVTRPTGVPVTIDGSWKLLAHNLLPLPFGTRVRLRIGDPIERTQGESRLLKPRGVTGYEVPEFSKEFDFERT